MDKKTVAVVVTHNRIAMLPRCVEALLCQSVPCDIFVVDNASTDGTGDWLREQAGHNSVLSFVTFSENIGGAGGFSFGMRRAAELGYGFVWVLDDDCLPEPDALEKLLEADSLLDGKYGWLSSVALWTDGSECRMNRQKLKKSFYEYSHLLKYGIIQAEQATFVSLFLRTETLFNSGLPIREFFIWGDDIEFTRRISIRMGLPCFVAGQSRVVHAMEKNIGSSIATDDAERISRYNYAFRNENYLYRKEGFGGFCYYTAKCGLNVCRTLAGAENSRLKRCGVIFRQYFSGLFFNPGVEYPEKK